ncbi:MAG TPA: DUF6498-containing protein [Gemmatimonadales bacterium]|nr:DUF6498-containing protein [Gemmatimonadales bacterium]
MPRLLPSAEALRRPSVLALIGANLVPVFGVFALDWAVFPLVLLFWLENVIVGAFNVLRILTARPEDPLARVARFGMAPFFAVHYGGFTLVHGIFVFALFGRGAPWAETIHQTTGVLWGAGALLLSHGFSFATNWLGAGEYRNADVKALMFQPYARVVVLHLTIIFGGMLLMSLGSPRPGLLLLVGLKILMDAAAHLSERARFAASAASPGAAASSSPVAGPGTGR